MEYKYCPKCGKTKPVTEFHIKRASKDGYNNYCKECVNAYAQHRRDTEPERIKEISAKTREKNREKIRERNNRFYQEHKNDPEHIKRRKESYERNRTNKNERERRKRKEYNEKYKHPCEKCGEDRLYLIQFHHINPSEKAFSIGANITNRSEHEIVNEIKKCVCLCSNCHDEFHYFYGSNPDNPEEALKKYLSKRKEK